MLQPPHMAELLHKSITADCDDAYKNDDDDDTGQIACVELWRNPLHTV